MEKNIKYIAYLLKKAKEDDKLPKPIVFLGAGASASAGIPLASKIVEDVKTKFGDNPLVQDLITQNENDYYKVMGCLTADQRRDLFYSYITHADVKINLTNIYLAQLLKEGYVDFVLTVNFDDLILKACALFNFLPPVYDLSNVKDPTTSNFREKSVIYLHGQHFGQWLLNKNDELEKVKNDVANIFNEIKNKRTWIVVGYSGQDEIFNQIASLGSFTSELFWVGYKNNTPDSKVMEGLIEKPHTNAHLVKGYDSDSFFLTVHSELRLETPEILNKPFSYLKQVIGNIKDVEGYEKSDDHKEKYENVKERLDISKNWIDRAINEIQNKDSLEKFKQEIIEATLKKNFDKKVEYFLENIKKIENVGAKTELSDFFNAWGNQMYNDASKNDKWDTLDGIIKIYERAVEFNQKNGQANSNLAMTISKLANIKSDKLLFVKSLGIFKKTTSFYTGDIIYNNWGWALMNYGELISSIKILLKSCEKFKKACEYEHNEEAYTSWAYTLGYIARLSKDEEKHQYYLESHEKAVLAYNLNPAKSYNLACSYALLDDKENALKYLKESIEGGEFVKDLLLDEDWKSFYDDPDFKMLIEKYQ